MITATKEYLQAIQDYENGTIQYSDLNTALQKWGSILNEGYTLNFSNSDEYGLVANYRDLDTNDINTKVDLNNLTTEQATELTNFTVNLINQTRDLLGLTSKTGYVRATTNALSLANEISKSYTDFLVNNVGHNVKKLHEIREKYNISSSENLGYQILPKDFDATLSMAKLKELTYQQIMLMLFNDEGSLYGHTTSLLGTNSIITFDENNTDNRITAIGVNTLQTNNSLETGNNGDTLTQINFELFPNFDNSSVSSYPQTEVVPNTLDVTTLNNNFNKANSAYLNAVQQQQATQTAYNNALTVQKDAQTKYNQALTAKNQAQTLANQTQANLTTATNAVKVAQADLASAKQTLTQAQQTLAGYNADAQVKLANLTKAKESLAQVEKELAQLKQAQATKTSANVVAQANLSKAQAKLSQAQADLATAQTNLTNSQATLHDLQATVQKLSVVVEKDKANVTQAQQTLIQRQSEAQAKLATLNHAKEVLADAQTKLNQLTDVKNQKVVALTKAQADLTTNQAKLNQAKQALSDAQTKLAQLQSDLVSLENAPALLAKAQAKLAQAQADYDQAQAVLLDKKAILADKNEILANAQANLKEAQTTLAALQAIVEAEQKAKEAELAKEVAKQNGFYVDGTVVKDKNGSVVKNWVVRNGKVYDLKGNLVNGVSVDTKTGALISSQTGQQLTTETVNGVTNRTQRANLNNQAKQLPQTGQVDSEATIVGATLVALSSLFGLAWIDKRKRG